MPRCFSSIRFALPLFALVAAGCADTGPLAPASPADAPSLSGTFGATLVECPTDVTRSDTATIGPLGGVLEVDGHRLVLPPFAVLLPTQFSITVPASNYVEIRVKANGHDNFQFNEVVQLTLSYARCTRSNIDRRTLAVFYIDPVTKTLLQNMGGHDNKVARTVTIGTDHLSGYALAEP